MCSKADPSNQPTNQTCQPTSLLMSFYTLNEPLLSHPLHTKLTLPTSLLICPSHSFFTDWLRPCSFWMLFIKGCFPWSTDGHLWVHALVKNAVTCSESSRLRPLIDWMIHWLIERICLFRSPQLLVPNLLGLGDNECDHWLNDWTNLSLPISAVTYSESSWSRWRRVRPWHFLTSDPSFLS